MLGEGCEEITADGLFTLEEEECLAACDKAPVLAVNYLFYDEVTPEALEGLVQQVRRGERPPGASRGGVPGELKDVSRMLAGLGAGQGGSRAR
jgi:NADH-quinone oxidoreductase subunit E